MDKSSENKNESTLKIEQKQKEINQLEIEKLKAAFAGESVASFNVSIKNAQQNLKELKGVGEFSQKTKKVKENQEKLDEFTRLIRTSEYSKDQLDYLNPRFEKFRNLLKLKEQESFSWNDGKLVVTPEDGIVILTLTSGFLDANCIIIKTKAEVRNFSEFIKNIVIERADREQPQPEWLGQELDEEIYRVNDIIFLFFHNDVLSEY